MILTSNIVPVSEGSPAGLVNRMWAAGNKILPLILLTLFFNSAIIAQVTDDARKIISDLCAPEMHGRGYVSKGDRKAARYIAGAYDRLGLEKLSGSYFQDFPIRINTFPSSMVCRIDNRELVPGQDYIVEKGSPSFKGEKEVCLVNRSDLLGDEWQGKLDPEKFMLLDNNRMENETSEQTRQMDSVVAVLKKGPPFIKSGLIICSKEKLTLKGFRELNAVPVITVRTQRDPRGIKTVYLDIDSRYNSSYLTCNVAGYIRGKTYPDSVIIFTAHYDHLGRMGRNVYFPGANDNASGVAMILSLAGHYANPGYTPEYSMLFIAFSAEEIGLYGSDYYVSHPLLPLENTCFLINIDLAANGLEGITVVNGTFFQKHFDLLKKINDNGSYLPQVYARGESCNSDHCRFYQEGVPAIFIYTMGGSTAYHDIYDTSESLPLLMFENYYKLLVEFADSIQLYPY